MAARGFPPRTEYTCTMHVTMVDDQSDPPTLWTDCLVECPCDPCTKAYCPERCMCGTQETLADCRGYANGIHYDDLSCYRFACNYDCTKIPLPNIPHWGDPLVPLCICP